jgi:hypothetical protein
MVEQFSMERRDGFRLDVLGDGLEEFGPFDGERIDIVWQSRGEIDRGGDLTSVFAPERIEQYAREKCRCLNWWCQHRAYRSEWACLESLRSASFRPISTSG